MTNAKERASTVAQMVKRLPTMWETWVWSLGWEDPLVKEMANHSSILVWKIPWTEEPLRLQTMGSQSQTPLSMRFSGQEYRPSPSPGDLPYSGIKPTYPALAGEFFTAEPPGKPLCIFSYSFSDSFPL